MSQKNRKRLETEEELLDAFLALLSEAAPDTEEEVDAFLVERGYNLEELNARAERVFKPALETSPLNWRNRARQGVRESRKKRAEHTRRRRFTRAENLAFIQAVQLRPGTAAHFRNADLDGMSEDDLQSMRDDLEFLQSKDENGPAEKE